MVLGNIGMRAAPPLRRHHRRLLLASVALAVVIASGGSAGVVLTRADTAPTPPPTAPAAPAFVVAEPELPEVPGVSKALGVPEVPSVPKAPDAPEAPGEPDDSGLAVAPQSEAAPASAPRDATPIVTAAELHDGADVDLIPPQALAAYQRSEAVMAEAMPDCHLDWTVIAAIGHLLTDHGRHGDEHTLGDEGLVGPAIIGLPIRDPQGRRLADSDAGELDGDRRHDRAVGPMLLAPSAWRDVGVDADMDGKRDPQDIDDASLAIAVLLCADSANLQRPRHLAAALELINADPEFIEAVPRVAAEYAADFAANDSIPVVSTASALLVQAVSADPLEPAGNGPGDKDGGGKSGKSNAGGSKDGGTDTKDKGTTGKDAEGAPNPDLAPVQEPATDEPDPETTQPPSEQATAPPEDPAPAPEPEPEPEPAPEPAPEPEPEPEQSKPEESPSTEPAAGDGDPTCETEPDANTCPTEDTGSADGESTEPSA